MMGDFELACRDPEKFFNSPMSLAQREDLTVGQRLGILAGWRQKVVEDGDLTGKQRKLLEIDSAIDTLIAKI